MELEESYYTVVKTVEGRDCDHGFCKLYAFEHGDDIFQIGIYEGDKVISIFKNIDRVFVEAFKKELIENTEEGKSDD